MYNKMDFRNQNQDAQFQNKITGAICFARDLWYFKEIQAELTLMVKLGYITYKPERSGGIAYGWTPLGESIVAQNPEMDYGGITPYQWAVYRQGYVELRKAPTVTD